MIVYREARRDDLNNIAKVHVECFPDYMISKLGNELVANYYKEFLEEDNLFVIAEEENEIMGFCMGYIRGSHAREKFVANNRAKLIERLLWLCCRFDTLAFSKVFLYLKGNLCKKRPPTNTSQDKKKNSERGDLLSICVKKINGWVVGIKLINEFEILLRQKGITEYTLTVYKKNIRAIRFYGKCGMTLVGESKKEYKFYKRLQAL